MNDLPEPIVINIFLNLSQLYWKDFAIINKTIYSYYQEWKGFLVKPLNNIEDFTEERIEEVRLTLGLDLVKDIRKIFKHICRGKSIPLIRIFLPKVEKEDILHYAIKYDSIDIIKLLEKYSQIDYEEGLFLSCKMRQYDMINYMITKGAIDLKNCLMEACDDGDEDMFRYLVTLGVDTSDHKGCYMGRKLLRN